MRKIKLFFKLLKSVSAGYYLFLGISSIGLGIQMLLNLYIPALFVEEVTTGISINKMIEYAVFIVVLNTVFYIFNQYMEGKIDIEKRYINDQMNQILSDKIMRIEYAKIENPYYLNLRQKALYAIEVQDAITKLVFSIATVVKKGIIMVELLAILYILSKSLVICIILLDVFITIFYIVFKKYEKNFFDKLVVLNRNFSYYLGLCFDDKLQKDIRIYNMSALLTNKVRTENRTMTEKKYEYYKKSGNFKGIISVFNLLQMLISYSYLIFRTFINHNSRRLNYGQFTFYINSIMQLFKTVREFIFEIVTIVQTFGYLEPYMEFMDLEDKEDVYGNKKLDETIESLEFKNVSFQYPETDTNILSDISFRIDANEKISIVGLNGAGKSTIVKLICRLYRPTKGIILINGVDIWEYEEESYCNNITAVFQDYKIFGTSMLENIACEEDGDYQKALHWLKELKMEYLDTKYEKGLNTELNKAYEDEGVDLSIGEKQKIGIIRALYKGGNLFILDEPTSALDPKSENEVYTQFERLTEGKMTIFISHRMSSSVLCDKVLVIDNGKVVEFGNHSQLIKNKESLYYKMFMAQAENYVD